MDKRMEEILERMSQEIADLKRGLRWPLIEQTPDYYARYHYDATTGERGPQIRILNRTGGASVKGEVLSASTAYDYAVIKQSAEYDSIAIGYEAGVADGNLMWVWVTGAMCQVLLKDTTAATRGYWAKAADTDGRAEVTTAPSGLGAITTDQHFREIGHCLQSVSSGTNVLAMILFHTL